MKTVLLCHHWLQKAVNWVIGVALAVLLTVILAQTVFRYAIFYSLPWSEELSRYLFVVMILLGINIGVTRDIFVRIDLIDGFLSGKWRAAAAVFRDLTALAVSCLFIFSSLPLMRIGRFQRSPAMQIDMNVMYGVLLVGFSLTTLAILLKLLANFAGERPSDKGV